MQRSHSNPAQKTNPLLSTFFSMEVTTTLVEEADGGFFPQLLDVIKRPDVGVLMTWAAVLLAALVVAKTITVFVLNNARAHQSSMPHQFVFNDSDDDWSSSSSDEESEDEELESEESEDEEVVVEDGDDGWRWSRSDFWETGRDGVVRSWEEESNGGRGEGRGGRVLGFEEAGGLVSTQGRSRDEIVRSFQNPAAQWEGGQIPAKLRRRVVDLGARGEERLGRLRNVYAADLASIGRPSSTAAAADRGLEAMVVAWCRNAASCLPIFSPNK